MGRISADTEEPAPAHHRASAALYCPVGKTPKGAVSDNEPSKAFIRSAKRPL
jgi:hypothetical protein